MSMTEQERRERHFVEEVGLWTEQAGMSRMAGRVLGRLLICDPPHQSSAELAEYLQASKASISTTTRLLISLEMAERVPVPGSRATYFAVRPETFDHLMEAEVARSRLAKELMAGGLDVLKDRPASQRRRLQELHDLFAFFEREMPALVERWRTERDSRHKEKT